MTELVNSVAGYVLESMSFFKHLEVFGLVQSHRIFKESFIHSSRKTTTHIPLLLTRQLKLKLCLVASIDTSEMAYFTNISK